MRDKLRIERKDLENYQRKITHTKSQVDIIDTPEDGSCLGFTYTDLNGVLVYIYYHEPSMNLLLKILIKNHPKIYTGKK